MPADEKAKQESKSTDQTPEPAPTKTDGKLKGFLPYVIVGLSAFIVGVAAFSFALGVFTSPPEADTKSASTPDSTAAVADQAPAVKDTFNVSELERKIFGPSGIASARNMDDVVALADQRKTESTATRPAASPSESDSIQAHLAQERTELEAKKSDLTKQQQQLEQLLTKTNQMESSRVQALARLYDGMKPSQVAPLLGKLGEEQVVQILLKMKPANAARILGEMEPGLAARISAKMITLTEETK